MHAGSLTIWREVDSTPQMLSLKRNCPSCGEYVPASDQDKLTQLVRLTVCENLGPVDLKIRAGVTCGRRAHFSNSRVHNIATVTRTV